MRLRLKFPPAKNGAFPAAENRPTGTSDPGTTSYPAAARGTLQVQRTSPSPAGPDRPPPAASPDGAQPVPRLAPPLSASLPEPLTPQAERGPQDPAPYRPSARLAPLATPPQLFAPRRPRRSDPCRPASPTRTRHPPLPPSCPPRAAASSPRPLGDVSAARRPPPPPPRGDPRPGLRRPESFSPLPPPPHGPGACGGTAGLSFATGAVAEAARTDRTTRFTVLLHRSAFFPPACSSSFIGQRASTQRAASGSAALPCAREPPRSECLPQVCRTSRFCFCPRVVTACSPRSPGVRRALGPELGMALVVRGCVAPAQGRGVLSMATKFFRPLSSAIHTIITILKNAFSFMPVAIWQPIRSSARCCPFLLQQTAPIFPNPGVV